MASLADLLPEPFACAGEHITIELPAARALFTTRRGGVSHGPYATLNLGRWTDDDPGAVERNRELVQEQAGARFAYSRQVHGTKVLHAETPTEADPPHDRPHDPPAEGDGHATAAPGIAPMVLTADCLPIALAGGGAVAMLHAGWRGLAGGVIAAGIQALRQLGAADDLAAVIGPGAGPCCYEVGEEVHTQFAAYGAAVRRGPNLDLKAIARAELTAAGVGEVHDCGLCTICADSALFFSHRRDRGITGRQAGVAWLS